MTEDTVKMQNFAGTISMIGPRIIFDAKSHIMRRIIWTSLVLAGLVTLFYQLYERIDVYAKHPISATYEINNPKTLQFPTVTLCNQNSIAKSFMERNKLQQIFMTFIGITNDAIKGKKSFSENATNGEIRTLNYTSLMKRGTMPLKDFIIINEAYYEGEQLTEMDFHQVITSTGVCYSFNDGLQGRTVSADGRHNGLHLLLNTQIHEYIDYMAEASAGFKIILTQPGALPDTVNKGIRVSPNMEMDVSMTQTVYSFLEAISGGECNATAKLRYLDSRLPYTRLTCLDECLADTINYSCGCYMETIPHPSNATVCNTMYDFACAIAESSQFYKDHQRQALCQCLPECEKTEYTASTFSTTLRPEYLSQLIPSLIRRKHQLFQVGINESITAATLQKNLGKVWIYFNRLHYEKITQIQSYSFWAMVSDVGGAMGLFLGSAILTLAEIIDFTIVLYCCKKKKNRYCTVIVYRKST